ncbi:MAG: helix-turn-helix domain-containing protein [Actinomycetota bacterium]|nr:helix-turn-helix domain-containing protein [Actinomycetota bacterium]
MAPRTGAERYLNARLEDAEYRDAYERARLRIDQIDRVIRALDERREQLNLSKAELARRAEMQPEAVRRIFSAERPNPTLHTLAALAEVLGLDLTPARKQKAAARPTRARSAASGTRRRTA